MPGPVCERRLSSWVIQVDRLLPLLLLCWWPHFDFPRDQCRRRLESPKSRRVHLLQRKVCEESEKSQAIVWSIALCWFKKQPESECFSQPAKSQKSRMEPMPSVAVTTPQKLLFHYEKKVEMALCKN